MQDGKAGLTETRSKSALSQGYLVDKGCVTDETLVGYVSRVRNRLDAAQGFLAASMKADGGINARIPCLDSPA